MTYQVIKINNKRDKVIHKRKDNKNQKTIEQSLCGKLLSAVNHTGSWNEVNCKVCESMMSYSAKYYKEKINTTESVIKTEKDIDMKKLRNFFNKIEAR